MVGTSYIGCVVKIIETPKQEIVTGQKQTLRTTVRVLLPQKSKKRPAAIARLTFWGKLATNVLDYYQINDYIMIEGYLSIFKQKNKKSKKIAITVLKVYPLFLTSTAVSRKI
jgi:single-stranded DNA-binding protein